MKKLTFITFIAALLLQACSGIIDGGKSISIKNEHLSINYSKETNNIQITENSNGRIFVNSLVPHGQILSAEKKEITDEILKKGESIVLTTENGALEICLYENESFALVTPTMANTGNDTLLIDRIAPLSFSIDLAKPVDQLKTLGTGGLLDVKENPGSYVFLTTVDPGTRNGVVSGWLSNNKGSGVLFSDAKDNLVEIKAQIDYGQYRIPAKTSEQLETFAIGYFDDARLGEESYADLLAKYNQIELRERSAVYCSWYSEKHGGAGDEASTIELASYVKDHMKPYGMGVIQLDDRWQDGGSYNGPTRAFDRTRKTPLKGVVINGTTNRDFPAGYPNGMEKTTKAIKDAGLVAGIWWMPFSRNHQDPEYADRQDWFAYRLNGEPYETNWGGTSLDLTNPKAMKQVADFSKILHRWGFDYFKMDGLWTGTVTEQIYINDGYKNDRIGNMKPLYNPAITQIEAYRNGLKTIREATNNEVFLSGCNVSQNMRSFGPSIGLVDAMRIGPDYNHDGESFRTGAIRASRLYFLNGRIWWNDPDPSMIREKGVSTADKAAAGIGPLERARVLPTFVALSSQFFLSSDWIPDLPEERKEIMRRCMASHTGAARPVDAFEKNLPSVWLASDDKSGVTRNVIGLFNWYEKEDQIGCDLDWAGLDAGKSYHAFDFWANKPLAEIKGKIQSDLPKESCQVIALREKSGHPVVVSTSQHITQGLIEIEEEKWNNNTLSGTSKLIGGDTYELRIGGLQDNGQWKVKNVKAVAGGKELSIKELDSKEKGWARINISSDADAVVDWEISFSKE